MIAKGGEQGNATASGPPPSTMSQSTTVPTLKTKRGLNVVWRTPRPVVVSMLNNKAVIQIEREQYDEACKSLSKALKLARKVKCQQQHQQLMQHYDNTNNQQQERQEHKSWPMAPPLHVVPAATTTPDQLQKQKSTKLSTKTDEAETTTTAQNEILRTVSDSFDSDLGSLNDKTRNNTSILEESCLSPCTNPVDVFDNIQLTNSRGMIDELDYDNDDEGDDHDVKNNTDVAACTGNGQKAQHHLDIINDASSSSSTSRCKPRPEYDEGMDVYKAPVRLGDSSRSLEGTILFNLGRLAHNLGNYDDALSLYKRSLLVMEKWGQRDGLLTLAIIVCVGQIQYARGDHVHSLKTYMTALSFAKSHFGEESLEVAACLNCIGVLHYIMPSGRDAIALDSLLTSLHLRLTLLHRDHIDVGTTLNNIGRVYFQQGKYEDAMEAYKESLRVRRKCQGDSVDVAATLFNIGQVYHQLDERNRALILYKEFLKLSKVHFGNYHRDICIVTTCIGQVSLIIRFLSTI